MTVIPAPETDSPSRSLAGASKLRVGVLCDFAEEGWPSMDLIGDILYDRLKANHADEIDAVQLRPRLHARFSRLPLPNGKKLFWNADRLINRFHDYPRWLRARTSDFDLFHIVDHSYAQLAHELPPERTVITCHDLDTFRCLVGPVAEPRPAWFRHMTQRVLDGLLRAAHIICVSRATETALLNTGLVSPDRVTVISYGVHPSFSTEIDPPLDREIEHLLGHHDGVPMLLHVGSGIPRKRIDVLLKVFAGVRKQMPETRLIRVGGALNPEQAKLADELGIRDAMLVLPFLTRERLASMYRAATVLLQTSDAEGFGLPVIEAMACGCPVVASAIPPLQEAAGPAASYCPVGDIAAWTETVLGLLHERATDAGRWFNRREEGLRHAAQFSWSENAAKTAAIYRRVASRAAVSAGADARK